MQSFSTSDSLNVLSLTFENLGDNIQAGMGHPTVNPFLGPTELADDLKHENEHRDAELTFAPRIAPIPLPVEHPGVTISLNPLLRSPRIHGVPTQIEWTLSQPVSRAVTSLGTHAVWNRPATRPVVASMMLRIEGLGRPVVVFPTVLGNDIITVGDVLRAVEHATAAEGVRHSYGITARWGGLYRSPDELDVWVVVIHGW